MGSIVEFRILGPVDVLDEGQPVPLPAGKPLTLLRVLLLNHNHVVSAETLVDELWGEEPPETAMKALQGHVSQLRKVLGAERLITKPPGYALRVEEGELDLDQFEQLARQGREHLAAGDAKAASRELESALALWRGPAPGLEERRLAALEDRIEADLALGRHAQLVPELETLVARDPLQERLRGQLMLALYRSGRQADALEQYRQTRATLVDQLGIEPSEELQELQRAILRHEPELDARRAGPGSLLRRRRCRARACGGRSRPSQQSRCSPGSWPRSLSAAAVARQRTARRPTCARSFPGSRTSSSNRVRGGATCLLPSAASNAAGSARAWQ